MKGIDVRQTGSSLLIRALLLDSADAQVTAGPTSLRIFELQSDGSLKTFDFSDHLFKGGPVNQETALLAHQQGNFNTFNTGIWTTSIPTATPEESSQSVEESSSSSSSVNDSGGTEFTAGNIYLLYVHNATASPAYQCREIQYGGDQGDLPMTYGIVDASAFTPTATAFETSLTKDTDNAYGDAYLLFLSGVLAGETGRVVLGYEGPTTNANNKGKITNLSSVFSAASSDGDRFVILGVSAG